jgi:hypothetical protein
MDMQDILRNPQLLEESKNWLKGSNRLVSTCYTSCTILVVTNMTGKVWSMSVTRGTNDLCVITILSAYLDSTMFVTTEVKNIHVLLWRLRYIYYTGLLLLTYWRWYETYVISLITSYNRVNQSWIPYI